MNLGTWIPQIFYDLIGRIVPGSVIIGCTLFVFQGPSRALKILATWSDTFSQENIPASLILLGSIVLFYIIGALLGSIWFGLCDLLKINKWLVDRTIKQHSNNIETRTKYNIKDMPNDISFIYDYIQLNAPKAGSRIAKLRAEQHMSGVLFIGILAILCIYISFPSLRYSEWRAWLVELFMTISLLTTLLLHWHLVKRFSVALCNLWLLLDTGLNEK